MRDTVLHELQTSAKQPDSRILIIYTGGTFGMGMDPDQGNTLKPFDFRQILSEIPSLKMYNLYIQVVAFDVPIDSSNVLPDHWVRLAEIIEETYDDYDGFVILHGTDTMAYSASAMSFCLENLDKPVIFTGAQLPISAARSDARENLITAVEIAAHQRNGLPAIPEVCIFFNYLLIRGNRAKKVESLHFDAFVSENYPPLAKAGVNIEYDWRAILERPAHQAPLNAGKKWERSVCFLRLFPGLLNETLRHLLAIPGLKGLVLETFGSGNAPIDKDFIAVLEGAINGGLVVLNVSQCLGGRVIQGKYETSRALREIGVVSGKDITAEAAITKLMYLLGKTLDIEKVKIGLTQPMKGEMLS